MKYDWRKTIYTDGSEDFLKYSHNKLNLKLRVAKNEEIEAVFLRTSPDGEQELTRMKKKGNHGFFDYYTAKIDIRKNFNNYRFAILTCCDFYWYNRQGLSRKTPPDSRDFKFIRDFKSPSWLSTAVFYQIFPDRFCNGNPSINIRNGEYTYEGKTTRFLSWGSEPKSYKRGGHLDFFGGDLAGIKEKIPYLKDLGVNALYLNPIFFSPSNHKYDTADYKKIDPHLGTNREFAELVSLLHKEGIRIILDGVFNHTGTGHYWFNKCGFYPKNTGAYNDPLSPWREYFTFYDKKDDYHCWYGVKTLPKLNYRSEKLRKEIYKSKEGIMNYWLSPPYNIDGWRLDVANMLGRQGEYQAYREIYREMREFTKITREDSYLMGEHFFDPSELLQGDMLDGVMNYQGFLFPLLRWLTKKERFKVKGQKNFRDITFTAEDFSENLMDFMSLLPFDNTRLMFNLLGCHDLPRFYSLMGENFSRYRMGAAFLFTYPGVPCVYYGDEIGMSGMTEYEARRCMIWEKSHWNSEMITLYKKLIALRKTHPALIKGGVKILHSKDEIFAFARFFKKNILYVILNNNPEEKSFSLPCWQIGELSGKVREFFSGELYEVNEGFLNMKLAPHSSLIISKERNDF